MNKKKRYHSKKQHRIKYTHADGTGRQPGGATRAQFTDPQNSSPNGHDTSGLSYIGVTPLASWLEKLTGSGNVEGAARRVRQSVLDGLTVRLWVGKKRLLTMLEPVHGSGGLMLHAWTQTYNPRGRTAAQSTTPLAHPSPDHIDSLQASWTPSRGKYDYH